MTNNIECRIEQQIWRRSTAIYFLADYQGKSYAAEPMELKFTELDPATRIEPALVIGPESRDFLPSLAQALIDCGYRDKAFNVDPLIKAKDQHLEDFRKIIFEREVTKCP